MAKYRSTEEGRAALRRNDAKYRRSERGRAITVEYARSEEGRASKRRYRRSEKGRAAQRRAEGKIERILYNVAQNAKRRGQG